jgi:hypothetical protein
MKTAGSVWVYLGQGRLECGVVFELNIAGSV